MSLARISTTNPSKSRVPFLCQWQGFQLPARAKKLLHQFLSQRQEFLLPTRASHEFNFYVTGKSFNYQPELVMSFIYNVTGKNFNYQPEQVVSSVFIVNGKNLNSCLQVNNRQHKTTRMLLNIPFMLSFSAELTIYAQIFC